MMPVSYTHLDVYKRQSLLCSILVAIPLGILSAHTKDSPFDVVVSGISSLGRSMPSFWVGIMLILLFGVTLKVLPVSGRGTWLNLVLPCATLTINTATQIVPLVRSGMLEICLLYTSRCV